MSKFALLLSLFLNILVLEASATPFRRLVNFEWEVIEGATSYEIELKQSKAEGGKTFKFKTKEAVWNGRLTPGNYMMRLRALDYRSVPGDWSADSEFNVGLEPAVLKSPAANAKIDTKENSTADLNFEWAPVGGADKYHFELTSEDGKTKIEQDVTEPKLKLSVPVAANYTWKVTSSSNEGINSEAAAVGQISVLGKAVEAPKVAKPESDFVRELKWNKPDNATGFDVVLFKYDGPTKKWQKYRSEEHTSELQSH